MHSFQRLFVLPAALLLASCASPDRIAPDYTGPDSGRVIVGMGAATGTMNTTYALQFRKRVPGGAAKKETWGEITFDQSDLLDKTHPADYQSSHEAGMVLVQAMPPGEYEIYNFYIFRRAGVMNYSFRSKTGLSIPFTVKPGQATYLGNYQANDMTGKNIIGFSEPAGAVFVVTDRLPAELPIAQAKEKAALGKPTDATPVPESIGSPFFIKPGKVPANG